MKKWFSVITSTKADADDFLHYYGTDRESALETAKKMTGGTDTVEIRIYNIDIESDGCNDFDYDTINRMEYDAEYKADFLEKKYRQMLENINRDVISDKDDYILCNIEHICEQMEDIVSIAQEDYYDFNNDTIKMIDKTEKAAKHLREFIDLYFYDEENLTDAEY